MNNQERNLLYKYIGRGTITYLRIIERIEADIKNKINKETGKSIHQYPHYRLSIDRTNQTNKFINQQSTQ